MDEFESVTAAADQAYHRVKRAIIRGEIEGGTTVSENTMSLDLGVSRTPMHDAFLRLAGEGLLSLEARKGAVVRPIGVNEAADLIEMRVAVEIAAVTRIIAEQRAAAAVPALRALVTDQRAALDAHDPARFIELDLDFHTAVIDCSRNRIAVMFARTLRDRQERLQHQLHRVSIDSGHAAWAGHGLLVDALESSDAEEYARVLHEHVSVYRSVR